MSAATTPAASAAAPHPDDYAIVVGLNDYSHLTPSPLRGCVNDASFFYEWLLDPVRGGLPAANVELILTGSGNGAPTKTVVEDAFIRFVERFYQNGQPIGRRLYLWFSGHGLSATIGSFDETALIMPDAKLISLERSVPGRLAAERLRKGRLFREVVLFMDCCNEVTGSANVGLGFSVPTGDPALGDRVPWLYGFATKWASVASEQELPHPFDPAKPKSWQGVFSHAVLEGLVRAVDDNGQITAASLARYVREATSKLLPADNNDPPDIRHDETQPPIVLQGPARLTAVHVALVGAPGQLTIQDGLDLKPLPASVIRPGAAPNTFECDLTPGRFYSFVVSLPGQPFARQKSVTVMGDRMNVEL